MPQDIRGFEYDVALSFAGENRDVAERLASELRRKNVRVFYDSWEGAYLWGKDLYQHLSHVYGRAARFCVVFISEQYQAKAWTNHELRTAQARALQENGEYILPVRLDDTDLPGVRRTIAHIDLRRVSIEELAGLLLQKLEHGSKSPGAEPRIQGQGQTTFRIPRLPRANADPAQDAHSLIEHVERVLDERVPVLRDAGLSVCKEIGEQGRRVYRIEHRERLVYLLRMTVGGLLGPNNVSFLDGWNEPSAGDAATAVAEVRRVINEAQPSVSITNFSLLDSGGVSIVLSFDELADQIWEKACRIVEAMVKQGR